MNGSNACMDAWKDGRDGWKDGYAEKSPGICISHLSFSCRRHLALRLENQTWGKVETA